MEVITGVGMIDISIEKMTTMSYLMFAVSGVTALAAVVLFFALDIARCWRMVAGKRFMNRKKRQKAAGKAITEKYGRPAGGGETFPMGRTAAGTAPGGETVLLRGGERTEVLGTISLEMIQDIVYMQDTVENG